jgi:hypothetical protein
VLSTTPANGATGVAVDQSPAAAFSENMDPASLTSVTFTLVEQGVGTPLAASVSYDAPSRTATLDPAGALQPNATYTATVKGGPAGAKDLGGNPLAADTSWTFQTNRSPTLVIDGPASTLTWQVGDSISFSGHATDPEQGALPASALTWTLVLQHCPSNCHSHTLESWSGVAGGSFDAPDHDYPSHLELRLTATDAGGASATTTVALDPETVELSFESGPLGLELTVGGVTETTPFSRTVIVGSTNSLAAPMLQTLGGTSYEFSSWSDGGAPAHDIVASASYPEYTAEYAVEPPRNTSEPALFELLTYPPLLTATNGSWTGSLPMTFTYQWLRCTTVELSTCEEIDGATLPRYVVVPEDIGLHLRIAVTATNAGGSESVTTEPTPALVL